MTSESIYLAWRLSTHVSSRSGLKQAAPGAGIGLPVDIFRSKACEEILYSFDDLGISPNSFCTEKRLEEELRYSSLMFLRRYGSTAI